MKKQKTRILFTLTLVLSFVLTGCGQTFDASRYVKACLDANTHGEFTDYAELTNTTAEEAEQHYNDLLDQEISYLDAYHVDDETKQKFRDLFVKMYKSFKYEVGEATKNDDNSYTVEVTTYKLKVFKNITEDMQTYITDYYQKESEAGNTPSEEEAYALIVDYIYDYISANLESLEYDEPVSNTATITLSNNVYSLSTTQLQDLLTSMVDLENSN